MDPVGDVIPSAARNLALIRSSVPQLQGRSEIPRCARNDIHIRKLSKLGHYPKPRTFSFPRRGLNRGDDMRERRGSLGLVYCLSVVLLFAPSHASAQTPNEALLVLAK